MIKKKGKSYVAFIGLGVLSLFGNILQKAMTTTLAMGLPGTPPHYFHKPWFNTLYMFIAMFLSIFVYIFFQLKSGRKLRFPISMDSFCFFAVPALCDLCMTVLHLVSFLYLGVSISLVIGFCRIIFSALIARFFLGQQLRSYQILAIGIIISSFAFVSVAIIKGTGSPPIAASPAARFFAVMAKLLAQLLDATKSAVEQHITHKMSVDSTFLVAAEGFWGLLATLFVCMPIVSCIPAGQIAGLSENLADTFAMLSNSKVLRAIVIVDMFYILFLNIFHMIAVESSSALFATLFESIQGAIVWATQVITYYILKGTKLDRFKNLGEQWTKWSFFQVAGFIIAIFAMLIYNGILKFNCFKDYPLAYEKLDDV